MVFNDSCPYCKSKNLEYDGIEEHQKNSVICQDVKCLDCHATIHVASNIEWDIIEMSEGITNMKRYRFVFERGGTFVSQIVALDDIINNGMITVNGNKKKFSEMLEKYEIVEYKLISKDRLITFDENKTPVFENDKIIVNYENGANREGIIIDSWGANAIDVDDGKHYLISHKDIITKIGNKYTAINDL